MDNNKEFKIYTNCISKFCQKNAKYNIELFHLLLNKIEDIIIDYEKEKIKEQKLLNEIMKIVKVNIKLFFKFNDNSYDCIFQNCNNEFNDIYIILRKNIDKYSGFLTYFITELYKNKFEKYDPVPKINEIIDIIKSNNTINLKHIKNIEKIIYDLLLKFFKVNYKYIIFKIKENKAKFISDSKKNISELRDKLNNPI